MPNLYGNLNGINVEQLQQLMQHAQALSQTPYAGPSSQGQQGDPSQGWGPGNQYSEYDRGYHENGAGRGAGPGDPSRRWNEEAQGWAPSAAGGAGVAAAGCGGQAGAGETAIEVQNENHAVSFRLEGEHTGSRSLVCVLRNADDAFASRPQMSIWGSVRLQPRAAPVLVAVLGNHLVARTTTAPDRRS